MRISDWSSDVCSSDLPLAFAAAAATCRLGLAPALPRGGFRFCFRRAARAGALASRHAALQSIHQVDDVLRVFPLLGFRWLALFDLRLAQFLQCRPVMIADLRWIEGRGLPLDPFLGKGYLVLIEGDLLDQNGRASCRERLCQYV